MRLHVLTLGTLIGAAVLAGCAHEETASADTSEFVTVEPVDVTPPPAPKITRYADENRDGQVTRAEAKADPALAASFDRYDLDDNGRLDRGEFARLEDARRQRAATRITPEQVSQRWEVEKPDGYFGPQRRPSSLNRTGEQPRPEPSE